MYNDWSFKALSTLGVILHLIFLDVPRDLYRWLTLKRKDVRGQVIVITGAGSGLGRRMAELFALRHGAKVAVLDVNVNGAMETVATITESGGEAAWWKCDIGNEKEMTSVAREIEEQYGIVDIVICNAAVLAFKFFMELSSEELKRSFDVNVIGTINTIRSFLGAMEKRNDGHIVAVSSIAGYYGETYGLAYCPSKFAVRGTMECLQMELRDRGLEGIKMTTICPYFARTPMVLDAGLRPTCTWFPFMSIDSCARRMVDSILKEKQTAFIPKYVTLLPITKGLLSINAARTLRSYMGIKYEPSNDTSERKVLPTPPDYFDSPAAHWMAYPIALFINFLLWFHPSGLNTFVPFVGPWLATFGETYPTLMLVSNIIIMLIHVRYAVKAMILCDQQRYSFACSFKWFAQTFIVGYASLSILLNRSNKSS